MGKLKISANKLLNHQPKTDLPDGMASNNKIKGEKIIIRIILRYVLNKLKKSLKKRKIKVNQIRAPTSICGSQKIPIKKPKSPARPVARGLVIASPNPSRLKPAITGLRAVPIFPNPWDIKVNPPGNNQILAIPEASLINIFTGTPANNNKALPIRVTSTSAITDDQSFPMVELRYPLVIVAESKYELFALKTEIPKAIKTYIASIINPAIAKEKVIRIREITILGRAFSTDITV